MNKKEFTGSVAAQVANTAANKAKSATGWQRVLWGIGAAIAAAVAWFCSGDTRQQPTVEQQTEQAPAE